MNAADATETDDQDRKDRPVYDDSTADTIGAIVIVFTLVMGALFHVWVSGLPGAG